MTFFLIQVLQYRIHEPPFFLFNFQWRGRLQALTRICVNCSKMNICESLNVGINGHGLSCASIIASQKVYGAQLGEFFLGDVGGNSPPPNIAVYALVVLV
ncbi:hypothetical protein DM860_010161 [Cuscuta australis]|uniref:Uncharacterized protein n=1 Tax=Cuscuta australis TaxID=267555 RepID=A0A328D6D0_9ASTE|nr:hypothetical protein DM860_010161 [Cuscuta australis]